MTEERNPKHMSGAEIMRLMEERRAEWGHKSRRFDHDLEPEKKISFVPDVYEFGDIGPCLLCGDMIIFVEALFTYKGVCGNCADVIHNLFNKQFSGEYHTWIEPRDETREKPYRKRKLSQTLRTKVLERDKYRCVECGTHEDLAVDHIFPERHGGSHDLNNLQTLCRSCNSRKRDRLPDD